MTSPPSDRPVSPLRARMIEDMSVRGFSEKTCNDYIRYVRAFAAFTGLNYDLVLKLVNRGDIPSVSVSARRRIDERWVQQWLAGGGAAA